MTNLHKSLHVLMRLHLTVQVLFKQPYVLSYGVSLCTYVYFTSLLYMIVYTLFGPVQAALCTVPYVRCVYYTIQSKQ